MPAAQVMHAFRFRFKSARGFSYFGFYISDFSKAFAIFFYAFLTPHCFALAILQLVAILYAKRYTYVINTNTHIYIQMYVASEMVTSAYVEFSDFCLRIHTDLFMTTD